jgi:hypothetical protein
MSRLPNLRRDPRTWMLTFLVLGDRSRERSSRVWRRMRPNGPMRLEDRSRWTPELNRRSRTRHRGGIGVTDLCDVRGGLRISSGGASAAHAVLGPDDGDPAGPYRARRKSGTVRSRLEVAEAYSVSRRLAATRLLAARAVPFWDRLRRPPLGGPAASLRAETGGEFRVEQIGG